MRLIIQLGVLVDQLLSLGAKERPLGLNVINPRY